MNTATAILVTLAAAAFCVLIAMIETRPTRSSYLIRSGAMFCAGCLLVAAYIVIVRINR